MAKYGKGKSAIESEEQQKLRFQVELEFVQCLGNPNYLNFLAQRGYFKDQAFINYLKYLLYWKEPEYAKFLVYPISLYFLDLLQHEHFRREIVNAHCAKFIDDQVILQWQHYTRKRSKMFNFVEHMQQHFQSESGGAGTNPNQQCTTTSSNNMQSGGGGGVQNGVGQQQNGMNTGASGSGVNVGGGSGGLNAAMKA